MREVPTTWTRVVLGLVAAGVLLAPWRHIAGTPSFATAGVVLKVGQVQAGLAQHPAAWIGRLVRIRGTAVGCRSGCVLLPAGRPVFGLVDHTTQNWIGDLAHALPLRVPLALGPSLGIRFDVAPPGPALYTVRLVREAPCTFPNLSSPCVLAVLQEKAG